MDGGAAFAVADVQVYLKYSTARLSPWNFTFAPSNLHAVHQRAGHDRVVVGLICGMDGIVGLQPMELFMLASPYADKAISIGVSRKKGHHYRVSSGAAKLPYTVSRDEFASKVAGDIATRSDSRLAWPLP